MIKINEIFFSIQGESSYTGWPTLFIRTSGCHLRCLYCDTTYAYNKGKEYSVEDIINICKQKALKKVCITGGEPLLQSDVFLLMDKLCELNFDVSLETSGDKSCKQVNSKVFKIIDIKTPDSGEVNSFNFDNLNLLDENYEYKFVIGSDKDFLWSLNFIKEFKLAEDKVLMSPSFNIYSQKSLAEKILSEKINVRFQTQLHKSIWPDCESGV